MHPFGGALRSNFERMRALRSCIGLLTACFWGLTLSAQDPCVSTGNGEPYVSTNPNYVCEALEAFVYINVAQGYANSSDAAPENFEFSWYPLDVLGGTITQSFEMVFDSTVTIWCVAEDLQNNCIWTDTITVQVEPAVEIGLPNDTLVCDLNGFTLQPSAEAQAMTGISWNWEPSLLLLNPETATPQLLIDADQWYYVTATTPAPGNCAYEDSIFVTANVAQVARPGPAAVRAVDLVQNQLQCGGHRMEHGRFHPDHLRGHQWCVLGHGVQPAGCVRTDTVTIDIFDNPVIALQAGGTACEACGADRQRHGRHRRRCRVVHREAGTTITVTGPNLYEAIAVVTGAGSASIPRILPLRSRTSLPTHALLGGGGANLGGRERPMWLTNGLQSDQPGALPSGPGSHGYPDPVGQRLPGFSQHRAHRFTQDASSPMRSPRMRPRQRPVRWIRRVHRHLPTGRLQPLGVEVFGRGAG